MLHALLLAGALAAPPLVEVRQITFDEPRDVYASTTLEGRYVVVLDEGSLALVRAADGRVLDVTELPASTTNVVGFGRINPYLLYNEIITGGPFMLLFSGENSWTEFEVQDDRLREVRTVSTDGRILDAAVRADGAVVLYRRSGRGSVIEVVPLQGVSGNVPVQRSAWYDWGFSLSSDGTLAAAFGGFCDVVDITDAASPRLLWSSPEPVISARFIRGGSALFATVEHVRFWFTTQIHDARSGAIEGNPTGLMDQLFFHGIGAISESAGISRAVVWRDLAGLSTLVFDTGSPTPQILASSPAYPVLMEFAPRPGGGWYETHNGWVSDNAIFIGEPDGSQVVFPMPDSNQEQLRNLRHGFFMTVVREVDGRLRNITLWRDTALNRPPHASAGIDRSVECADRAGTPVELDGSASSDPDSTPETADDVASYTWSVDGGAALDGPSATFALAPGEHAVSLTVADVLGAQASDDLSIQVTDTLPPAVDLTLAPVFTDGRWSNRWTPNGGASDLCDGSLGVPDERLTLPSGAQAAAVSFTRSLSPSIELRRRHDGALDAKLAGPDETAIRAAWAAAAGGGGFTLADGAAVGLVLAPAGKGRDADLVVRYDLDGAGSLSTAVAFGGDQDHVVTAFATDLAGHAGAATASLRATIVRLCAQAPGSPVCAGGPARPLSLRSGQVRRRR